MAPPYWVIESMFASVVEPTESMPAAHRSLAKGRTGPDNSLRAMISAAPRPFR